MAEVSRERDLWASRGQFKHLHGRCLQGVSYQEACSSVEAKYQDACMCV